MSDRDCSYIYVSDTNNHRVMRWGRGARKGTMIVGNCTESSGAVVVKDPRSPMSPASCAPFVRFATTHRGISTVLCQVCRPGDGPTDLKFPQGVAVFGDDIYIADRANHRVLRRTCSQTRVLNRYSTLVLGRCSSAPGRQPTTASCWPGSQAAGVAM